MIATEYCKNVFDGTHDSPKFLDNGYLLVTSKNIANRELDLTGANFISEEDYNKINERSKVHQWDIFFSMIGTVGNVFLQTEKEVNYAIKNMGVFSCENEDKAKWLYYYLQSPYFKKLMNSLLSGAVQKFVPLGFLRSIDIPKYDDNKKAIVKFLSSLDDKIALNNRINAKLEQMAKRLYDYWFVQFDFPNADGKPYKSTGGKMVWNEELKREIPEGWEVKKISEILDCEIPGDWGEEEIKGNHKYKVNCIRGCDMVDMTDLPVRYILESNSKKLLQKDDFVIEISGGSPTQSTGRIVQITDEIIKRFNGKIICSNFCHGIRLNDKDYASYFFQMWNMFYLNNIFFNYEGKTSGLKNFQFDTFVSETWYVPPKELVRKYHEVVSKFRKQIDINESETQKLTVLRDRLLPLLMNGQVEVE